MLLRITLFVLISLSQYSSLFSQHQLTISFSWFHETLIERTLRIYEENDCVYAEQTMNNVFIGIRQVNSWKTKLDQHKVAILDSFIYARRINKDTCPYAGDASVRLDIYTIDTIQSYGDCASEYFGLERTLFKHEIDSIDTANKEFLDSLSQVIQGKWAFPYNLKSLKKDQQIILNRMTSKGTGCFWLFNNDHTAINCSSKKRNEFLFHTFDGHIYLMAFGTTFRVIQIGPNKIQLEKSY